MLKRRNLFDGNFLVLFVIVGRPGGEENKKLVGNSDDAMAIRIHQVRGELVSFEFRMAFVNCVSI